MSPAINLNRSDREMLVFAQMIAKDDQNEGIRLLYDYWAMLDRFSNIKAVFGSPMMRFGFEDIRYIFPLDHICEELYDNVEYLLGGRSPFRGSGPGTNDSDVSKAIDSLMLNLSRFKKIRTSRGWETVHREAFTLAAPIIADIKTLGTYHRIGKTVHISTNLSGAGEFFSSKVDFNSKTGKYLLRGD